MSSSSRFGDVEFAKGVFGCAGYAAEFAGEFFFVFLSFFFFVKGERGRGRRDVEGFGCVEKERERKREILY